LVLRSGRQPVSARGGCSSPRWHSPWPARGASSRASTRSVASAPAPEPEDPIFPRPAAAARSAGPRAEPPAPRAIWRPSVPAARSGAGGGYGGDSCRARAFQGPGSRPARRASPRSRGSPWSSSGAELRSAHPMLREGRGDLIAADLTGRLPREGGCLHSPPGRGERVRRRQARRAGAASEAGAARGPHRPRARELRLRRVPPGVGQGQGARPRHRAGPESIEPEELVYQVSRGERPLTVADTTCSRPSRPTTRTSSGSSPSPRAPDRLGPAPGQPRLRLALTPSSPSTPSPSTRPGASRAISADIRKRGVLRVLTGTTPSPTSCTREQHGFDFELIKAAAEAMGYALASGWGVRPARPASCPG